jgi:glucosamine--fructose-6-phosphate aminotransferase (isomerizing)
MCGIIGYIGKLGTRNPAELLYQGLEKLEYRGYDSAGIALLAAQRITTVKTAGKLARLRPLLSALPSGATLGMGHTRWATHGEPTDKNAHPHGTSEASIIHNGILENYRELKLELIAKGVTFTSDTDTEVIVQLLLQELQQETSVQQALLNILPRLQGAYSLGIISLKDPDHIYVVKQGSPLVIGCGEGEMFFASDPLPLVPYCKKFIFLEDGEFAKISRDQAELWNFAGEKTHKTPISIDWDSTAAEKNGFSHYMLKEIHEQPRVFSSTIARLVDLIDSRIKIENLGLENLDLPRVKRLHFVACGTAYYAAMVGKYLVETLPRISCEVELASEFRYREPFVSADTLVIAVSQSGETADTLACIKYAKAHGCQTFALCNVRFSSIPRECLGTLYMEAGPEIGVASTKAFTSMLLNLYILSLALAQLRGQMDQAKIAGEITLLKQLPQLAEQALSHRALISATAQHYFHESHCLFLGRGFSYAIALEGALKLKEISYIHAEGYAGGELKHGPIALVDRSMPIVAVIPRDKLYDKMLANIEEVRARQGRIIAVAASDDAHLTHICERLLPCPQSAQSCLQGILSSIILQQFAYYVALHRGTDVDQPRNLAKSVTVE